MHTYLTGQLLLSHSLLTSEDVVIAKQHACRVASLLGIKAKDQARIAIAVFEIAYNAYQHGKHGTVSYYINRHYAEACYIIKIADKGKGIAKLEQLLTGQSSQTGIFKVKKNLDSFVQMSITTAPDMGSEFIFKCYLGKDFLLTTDFVRKIIEELKLAKPPNLEAEIANQNKELLNAFTSISLTQGEVEQHVQDRIQQLVSLTERLNREISDRNRSKSWLSSYHKNLSKIERITSMGELASALAHEVNQPLAAITAYTQGCIRRLKKGVYRPEELIDIMRLVAQQSVKAGEIIHRLKNFTSNGELEFEKADLNKAILETVNLMQYEIEKYTIKVALDLDESIPMILFDVIHIQRVITNFMCNGIEAMHTSKTMEPQLWITTKKMAMMAVVDIVDSGPGLLTEDIQLLLEPYFSTKKKGRGMGLSISNTLIQAHGGKLSIKNHCELGAWIQFTLPFKGIR